MSRRILALLITLAMLSCLTPALAAERFTASTPLSGSGSGKLHNLALAGAMRPPPTGAARRSPAAAWPRRPPPCTWPWAPAATW